MNPSPFLGRLTRDAVPLVGGFAVLFLVSAAVAFVDTRQDRGAVEQPIRFDHALHVEEQGLECSACHAYYASETYSGLPGAQFCSLCHLEPQGESAEEQRLSEMLREGEPLEWVSLFGQPPHVFFSHRRHVVVAEIECVTCHEDIGQSTAPPTERKPLRMARCIRCHEENGASRDCSACHR